MARERPRGTASEHRRRTVTLTTKFWMDGLIETPDESWVRGGTPAESRIVPWSVQSIDHEDIDFWQSRLDGYLVDQSVAALVEELP